MILVLRDEKSGFVPTVIELSIQCKPRAPVYPGAQLAWGARHEEYGHTKKKHMHYKREKWNMQDLLRDAEKEKKIQENLRRKMVDALRNMTPGYLVKKGDYYYWRKKEDEGFTEKYLGREEGNLTVRRLKRKKYFQTTIEIIDKNIKALDRFIKSYKRYDPMSVASSMGNAYQIPPDSIFAIMGLMNPKNWEKNYTKNSKYPEHLKHTTDRGEKVRSKSEIVIYNALAANNILFRYECRLRVGYLWYRPDFMILLTKDNRIVIWEHFGHSDDPIYLKSAMDKIRNYIENGYVLWYNLIITFEDKDGNIDAGIVSRIIETCLL